MPSADCIPPHLSIPADEPRFLCFFFVLKLNMDEHKKYIVRQYKCKQSGPSALAKFYYGRGGCEHTETDGTICQVWVVHACLLLSFFCPFLSLPLHSVSFSESVLDDCPGQAHQKASAARVSCQTSKQNHSSVGSVTHPLLVSSLLMENDLPEQPF